ncbi:ATP-binding cassette domain-containing protein [Glutamicibacter sp. M10]|nr:ATP-binding cassette domain-containing protein [Glutamicibacter sp. M10]
MPTESGTGDGNTCLVRATKARREEAPLLATSNFEINLGQRWLVTGPNGAGKTSLLKLLAGELDHSQGQIWRAENLSYAWLRQELGQTPEKACSNHSLWRRTVLLKKLRRCWLSWGCLGPMIFRGIRFRSRWANAAGLSLLWRSALGRNYYY